MVTRIVVGYTANESGADALALGGRLAAASEALLEVVMVLPIEARGAPRLAELPLLTPPERH